MAKPSLTNIILFYNMSIGRKELFIKKCNIWLISLEWNKRIFIKSNDKNKKIWYTLNVGRYIEIGPIYLFIKNKIHVKTSNDTVKLMGSKLL